uniref:Endonuclease/exonuclease/phosphatase domain-containing protein n=1 Tax=Latimeria chalumnae TaxID=7897 RepID=H3A8G6_LATCH
DQARRYKINGYKLVSSLQHPKYGLAIYVRNEFSNCIELPPTEETTTSIKLGTLTIVNVYKPPTESWPKPALQKLDHSTIYVGDFNSHHTDWGYEVSDANGEALTDWMSAQDVHLVFDAKHHATFRSARHAREYNPDLTLVLTDGVPIHAPRHVFPVFPHSQHKPVIIHVGIEIPVMAERQRGTVLKARWKKQISRIPPTPKNSDRFVALLISAGKNNILRGHRKGYIPCWTPNCENLLRQYEQSEDPAAASALLDALDAARCQRWIECMESLDFTHSSRRAWVLLRKLGAANPVVAPDVKVKPDAIAAYLVANSKGPLNKQYKQEVKRQLRKVMTACPESSALSTHFSSEELATTLTATKKGKAAGKDGIPPDFLHHLGPRARKWLLEFFSGVMDTGVIPRI